MIYLLIYDRTARSVLALEEFRESDTARSDAERAALEERYRQREDVEVVTLTSDSRETLRRTHGRYFLTDAEIVAEIERRIA